MEKKFCYGCMRYKQGSPFCELCGFDERRLNEEHQLPIGTVLRDQYVIGRVLGEGGFGITYMGWDRLLEMPVAIKEYFPRSIVHRSLRYGPAVGCNGHDREIYEKHRDRFLKEARTIAQLSSVPEIVQVKNFFADNNTAYIVMEYVEGITLKDKLKQMGRPMTEAEALEIMDPVLKGLAKVHDRNLIHRDISPDNIMIPKDGGVKLIDFGTARNMDDSMRSRSTESILKPGFAPMEQYNSRGNIGTWTDVYAICATFHYLLVGKLPPDAPSRIEDGEALPMLEAMPGISPSVKAALQKGMAIRVADRVQTIRELSSALYAANKTQPPEKETDCLNIPVVDPKKEDQVSNNGSVKPPKKKLWVLGLAAAMLVAVVALGFRNLAADDQNKPIYEVSAQPSVTAAAVEELDFPEEQQEITLKVWGISEDVYTENSWLPVMLRRFEEAHPEYRITWDIGICEPADAVRIIMNDPAAAADVYMYANDQMGTLIEAGALAKLGGSYLQQVQNDFAQPYIDTVTYTDGGVYGFPMDINTWFLWYNKDVFTEEDIKSLNTMLEKGVVSFPMNNSWYTASFLLGAGGTLFGPGGYDPAAGVDFDSEDCIRAGSFMLELVRHRNFVNDTDGQGVYGMMQGSVHAVFSGEWDKQQLQQALGDKLGCAVLPFFTVDGRTYPMKAFLGGKAIGVNPNCSEIKAAIQLASFLASAESQLLRYNISGIMPVARECGNAPEVQRDVCAAVLNAQGEDHAVAQPVIVQMGAYWNPMKQFGDNVLNGSVNNSNIRQALSMLENQING